MIQRIPKGDSAVKAKLCLTKIGAGVKEKAECQYRLKPLGRPIARLLSSDCERNASSGFALCFVFTGRLPPRFEWPDVTYNHEFRDCVGANSIMPN